MYIYVNIMCFLIRVIALSIDTGSSTSYEPYDEPEGEEPYNNVTYDGQPKTDVLLPR